MKHFRVNALMPGTPSRVLELEVELLRGCGLLSIRSKRNYGSAADDGRASWKANLLVKKREKHTSQKLEIEFHLGLAKREARLSAVFPCFPCRGSAAGSKHQGTRVQRP